MNATEALSLGFQHHQAGRLSEAEAYYRQALALHPDHPDALGLMGVLAHQVGKSELGLQLLRRAVSLQPDNPELHSNLAAMLMAIGKPNDTLPHLRRAVELNPSSATAHRDLGIALVSAGQRDEAIEAFRRALTLSPDFPDAMSHLADALRERGETSEAESLLRRAIELQPDLPQAHLFLGNVLRKIDPQEAVKCYRRAIELAPNSVDAHNNLGSVLLDLGSYDASIKSYEQALAISPDNPAVRENLSLGWGALGSSLQARGDRPGAFDAFEKALALKPDSVDAMLHLAGALAERGQCDQALALNQKALALRPDLPAAHYGLGISLQTSGDVEAALAAHQKAIDLDPGNTHFWDGLLLLLHYSTRHSPQQVFARHREWAERCGLDSIEPMRRASPSRDPDRKLRIGYVSGDFRVHSVAYFIEPTLDAHDAEHFHVTCYSNSAIVDHVTRRLQQHAHEWHSVHGVPDKEVAEQIIADRIDILIDLSGHTPHHRLAVFSRKPASIQCTWLGYPNTTGLKQMDFWISDPHLNPSACAETLSTERIVQLDETFACFRPPDESPEVNALPAPSSGRFTFGSFNNALKLNDQVIALWARLLREVPESRLMLVTPYLSLGTRHETLQRQFAGEGISADRIELLPAQSIESYLKLYHRCDLALDPFPFTGHTVSLQGLWMGVPMVTLVGQTHVSRRGVSILRNLQLDEFIAENPDEYLRIAANAAKDLDRLGTLRASLRDRMRRSPLMDAARFTRSLESRLQEMWREYCRASGRAG